MKAILRNDIGDVQMFLGDVSPLDFGYMTNTLMKTEFFPDGEGPWFPTEVTFQIVPELGHVEFIYILPEEEE